MKNILLGVFFLSSLFEMSDAIHLEENGNKESTKEHYNVYDIEKSIHRKKNTLIKISNSCKTELHIQNYSITQINAFIEEAYSDNYQVFIDDSKKHALLVDFFQNRLSFETSENYAGKVYRNISDLELDTKYNSNQQRDLEYDLQTFNPLKYKIEFFPQKTIVYKLGDTQYYMLIQPRR